MPKKQTSIRIDDLLFAEFTEFCESSKAKQEGVMEAAIYWVVHRLPRAQYLDIVQEASRHVASLQIKQKEQSATLPSYPAGQATLAEDEDKAREKAKRFAPPPQAPKRQRKASGGTGTP